MKTKEITETLEKYFQSNRIVLWNDAEAEFVNDLGNILPAGIELLRTDEIGAFAAKIHLEIDEPEKKFLVYSPTPKPAPADDWLLDIRFYSHNFTADSTSILLNDLGLQTQGLRPFLQTQKEFFSSGERYERLKRIILPDDNRKELERKMIAVAVKASQAETSLVLLRLFGDFIREFTALPEDSAISPQKFKPEAWKTIEKYGLGKAFWNWMSEGFAYESEKEGLYNLLVRLFVTDFARNTKESEVSKIKDLIIENPHGAGNASVFLANWRMNSKYSESYQKISQIIETDIHLEGFIGNIPALRLSECETFEMVERQIIVELRDRLMEPLTSADDWQSVIDRRRDMFWCFGKNNAYEKVYQALAAASNFYRLREEYRDGFNFPNAEAVFRRYTEKLYLFDRYYRLFCEYSKEINFESWDVLKPLSAGIENSYGNWFLANLAECWDKCLEHEQLFSNWKIDRIPNQYKFYNEHVKPILDNPKETKVYIIISDAFRYECAEGLVRELNSEARRSGNALLEADLETMLGVVPSYTALGMASLLPHDKLGFNETNPKADIPLADGKPTDGFENRRKILADFDGIAIKAEEFSEMKTQTGRDFVRDSKLIYIYHNVIDARGDTLSTESDTFEAVRKTLRELTQMVNYIFNSLNGSRIFITSDHGFLFQRDYPETLDRSTLDIKSDEVLKCKKRYVIDPKIKPQENAWHGYFNKTANTEGGMEFLIPKGANRFHFKGGSRFIHGGAMPQEICIPVIKLKKLRGKAAAGSKVAKVNVTLLGNITRIVNNVQRFEFIQTDSVSDRVLPRTLQIYLCDEENTLISNEVTITFNSDSDSIDNRRKDVKLILKTGEQFDRKRQYYLVLKDKDDVIEEYAKFGITIDIAFSTDF